ncbi:MAG: LPS assembly protein LptD [Epibacterium sp.]|nr:LPS assembly protein LptD [Epibacterium sp.]
MRLIPRLPIVAPVLALMLQSAPSVTAQTQAPLPQGAPPLPQTSLQPASLVADKIFVSPERDLIAEGNVEAFYGNTTLQARRLAFDRNTGRLRIEGPIRINDGTSTTILANSAEIDKDLHNGILRGAYMVFDQQVQLASLQMNRVEGRYTQLYKSTLTSCDVCADGRVPIWSIRAQRITHDNQDKQLYLENAQLRLFDAPVFYFPALRFPDPTLDRATGFLVPRWSSSTHFGIGLKVPYFVKMGDHRDVTITPFLAEKSTALHLRYRQAFHNGQIEILTGIAKDELSTDSDRGYVLANGQFDLRRGYDLRFNIQSVSDNDFLADYDISGADRLRSELTIIKARRDKLLRAGLVRFNSLRDGEPQKFVPTDIIAATYEERFFPKMVGGEGRIGLDILNFNRSSGLPATASEANGRDMSRISADADWRRQWRLPYGILAEGKIGVGIDRVGLTDDAVFRDSATLVTPRTALSLRLPLQRTSASGDQQLLEPLVQIGWTNVSGGTIPNEASNISEFDQGNLLSLSRFPEDDAREDGLSVVYGLHWQHLDTDDWQLGITAGQIWREDPDSRFSDTSGLDGSTSDLLLATQLQFRDELTITARGLWDKALDVSKAEVRGDWRHDNYALTGSYLWLQQDADENRSDETNELWLDGSYDLNGNWTAAANVRYNIADDRTTRAGLALTYQNECVTLNLSLNRRFTSTESVEPTTKFGFTLSLNGFSVKSGNRTYRRSCSIT